MKRGSGGCPKGFRLSMKRKTLIFTICVVLFAICLCALIALMVMYQGETLPGQTDPSDLSSSKVFYDPTETDPVSEGLSSEEQTETDPASETEPLTEPGSEQETDPATEPASETGSDEPASSSGSSAERPHHNDSLLDFTNLKAINPDIYAWITIPGTVVDYPILQSPTDDSFYLTHSHDGSYFIGGSLFSEHEFNSTDFNDPVTLIYGHYMRSGKLFGSLQSTYSYQSSFNEHQDIIIYLPGEVRHYRVFAAVPYDTSHILYYHNFKDPDHYRSFLNRILSTTGSEAKFDSSIVPEPGDRLLVLSTCLNGDNSARYLIISVLEDDLQ